MATRTKKYERIGIAGQRNGFIGFFTACIFKYKDGISASMSRSCAGKDNGFDSTKFGWKAGGTESIKQDIADCRATLDALEALVDEHG